MLCINNSITDVYFNLAAEEYLLQQVPDTAFMLWRNQPSVILGKHQQALMEVNADFAKQHHIAVARRLSGGGAVYHDLGNLNFTFIENKDKGDFHQFTTIIIRLLAQLGIKADAGERNMIMINGLKISGSAQCIHKNKVLHHGTLLFDSNLAQLSAVLKIPDYTVDYRLVKSVRSAVTNIKPYLPYPMDIGGFSNSLMNGFMKETEHNHSYTFNEFDIQQINYLRDNKYSSNDWIFKTFSPSRVLYE